jgi:hypothetical protein
MPEETMILRDAALRLARARTKNPKTNRIQSSKLLSVLRSGDLKAGFYILGGTVWIEIPLAYWHGIDSSKFRRISRTKDPKSGTYPIRANEFPDQVASIICNEVERGEQTPGQSKTNPNRGEIAAVIDAAAQSCEVTVKTNDFLAYLKSHRLEERTIISNVGAPRKESWRELCSYMAAYVTAFHRDYPAERLNIEAAAKRIRELAEADGIRDLPHWTTIKEKVSAAMRLLEEPKFKLKK